MSDYTLSAKITADTSDFEAGIDEAKGSLGELGDKCDEAGGAAGESGGLLSKLREKIRGIGDSSRESGPRTSKFSGALKALGSVGMGVGMQLGQRAFSAIADLSGEMIEASDSADKFASTLSFAGIDDSAIKQLTASTQEYADKTVYGLSDVRNITAQLAANGVADYDKLAQAAGNLNAVAGGNAETFSSVGMVLTQTAGAGKLTTENWNQLADAIPGASGKLQEAMKANGAYTGDFREAMANGEITAEEFNKAIMDLGFTDAAVEAATSTQTIEGAVGNLQAAFVGLGSGIITAIKPALTGGMTAIADFVGGIGTSVGEAGGILNEYIANFSEKFNEINTEMGGMATVGDVVACAIQEMGGAFGLTAEQTAPFANMMASLVDTFAPIVEQVQAQLMPALSALGGSLGNLAAAILPVFMAAVEALAPVVASAISAVVSIATTIAQTLAPAIDGIAQIVQAVLPVAQAAFQAFGDAVKGVIDAVFPFIESVISNVMNVINAVIRTVLALIKGDWEGAWNGIKAVGQAVWDAIKSIVTAGINAAKGVISSVLDSIKSTWDSCWNGIKSLFSQIWDGIKSAAKTGVDNVYKTVTGIKDKITGFFSDAGKWLVDSGKAIMQGLADGIAGAVGWVVDKVSGAVGKIRDLFPNSPAKKGPFSGRGWVLYSGISVAEAFGDGFTRAVPGAIGKMDRGLGEMAATVTADFGSAYAVPSGEPTGGQTNIYIDGAAVNASPALSQAMGLLFDALNREYDMGVC